MFLESAAGESRVESRANFSPVKTSTKFTHNPADDQGTDNFTRAGALETNQKSNNFIMYDLQPANLQPTTRNPQPATCSIFIPLSVNGAGDYSGG
jgi:hypothetical protein